MELFYFISLFILIQSKRSLIPAILKNGIYSISFKKGNYGFSYSSNKKKLSDKIILKPQEYKDYQKFRILKTNSTKSEYYIESIPRKRLHFQNLKKRIELTKKKKNERIFIIIKDLDGNYYIRDHKLYKFFGINDNNNFQFKEFKDESDLIENKNFQIEINYLYTEYKSLKKSDRLDSAKIDVVYTFVDLSDPNLNRKGIEPLAEEVQNDELKYSLRSVLKYIPWVNKIFIIMPNQKVKFLKHNLNDSKITYINDKDLLGFDSSSSVTIEFNLWKLKKFGVSDNIIYFNDDFFIGRSLKKTDFFYEDENNNILPLCNYKIEKILKKKDIEIKKKEIQSRPHSGTGFKLSVKRGVEFLFKILKKNKIKKVRYHSNALAVNLNEVKEIYDLVDENYEYKNEVLSSVNLNNYQIQFQNFYVDYIINKYDRPVKRLVNCYIDLKQSISINKEFYKSPLFCINASGSKIYTLNDFKNEHNIMEALFPDKTIYEIDDNIKNEL